MAKINARHILVSSEERCIEVRKKIEEGRDFATVAMRYSDCPSAAKGGEMGEVRPGEMGEDFDNVIFTNEDVGVLKGPVKTKFGYHLVEVTSRTP